MKQITGRYATAIVYTDIIEETATEQIRQLCDQSFVEDCSIRIMPDVHAGTGCVIGFTADLGQLLIPINMRDGSLLCIGKGNHKWNCSAPHGAGRLFSRGAARQNFTVEAYAKEMNGIYTTSVSEETLDECPMAYKPMESIVANVEPTVEIVKVIRPVYNFKAGK